MSAKSHLILGATRGIGLEFTTQLLAQGHLVLATYRSHTTSTDLFALLNSPNGKNLTIEQCDVSDEASIKKLVERVGELGKKGGLFERGVIDVVVVNAGMLVYPGLVSEISFPNLLTQIQTNTIGPLIFSSSLLALPSLHVKTLLFISSDSGSQHAFLGKYEEGFGAYAISKCGLNMGIRCLASELSLKRQREQKNMEGGGEGGKGKTVILAIHPGEVDTDIVGDDVELGWEVKGVIEKDESVKCMLDVISEKGFGGVDEGGQMSATEGYVEGEASFWDWKGERYPW